MNSKFLYGVLFLFSVFLSAPSLSAQFARIGNDSWGSQKPGGSPSKGMVQSALGASGGGVIPRVQPRPQPRPQPKPQVRRTVTTTTPGQPAAIQQAQAPAKANLVNTQMQNRMKKFRFKKNTQLNSRFKHKKKSDLKIKGFRKR